MNAVRTYDIETRTRLRDLRTLARYSVKSIVLSRELVDWFVDVAIKSLAHIPTTDELKQWRKACLRGNAVYMGIPVRFE